MSAGGLHARLCHALLGIFYSAIYAELISSSHWGDRFVVRPTQGLMYKSSA